MYKAGRSTENHPFTAAVNAPPLAKVRWRAASMDYPIETFTDEERALLAPHFTNLDAPVFALVNLPETVKGALFAR